MDISEGLLEIAVVEGSKGEKERAKCLWAAGTALQAKIGVHYPAIDPLYQPPATAELRETCSSKDWPESEPMPLEQAIAYALDRQY